MSAGITLIGSGAIQRKKITDALLKANADSVESAIPSSSLPNGSKQALELLISQGLVIPLDGGKVFVNRAKLNSQLADNYIGTLVLLGVIAAGILVAAVAYLSGAA